MFEDSLFDSGAGSGPRKTWPKLASFAIEVSAIGVLVLLPLIYTQALPKQMMWNDILETPPPPLGRAPVQEAQPRPRVAKPQADDGVFRQPSEIPRVTSMQPEDPAAEGPPSMDGLVTGGVPGGVASAVITEIARSAPPVMVKRAGPVKLRVSSGVAAGMLVHQVKPQYPPLAMQAHI